MKAWRIIRTILLLIAIILSLIVGYLSYDVGDSFDKSMFSIYVICCIFGLPSLIKDMLQPYKGKPEPKRFVRNRLITYIIISAVLSFGVFWLITINPENITDLTTSLGADHRWWLLIFFVIFGIMFMVIELLMCYLPRRLGYEEDYGSEEEEAKSNKVATIITIFAIAILIGATLLPTFVPAIYDYINESVYDWLVVIVVAVNIVGGMFLASKFDKSK